MEIPTAMIASLYDQLERSFIASNSPTPATGSSTPGNTSIGDAVRTHHRDGKVDVTGEPWLRAGRNRETTDHGPWDAKPLKGLLGVFGDLL